MGLVLKYHLLSIGCLSILHYVHHPKVTSVAHLGGATKRSLNQAFAAPEILRNVLTKTSVDMQVRWTLVGLRFWYFALKKEPMRAEADVVSHTSMGRLGMNARDARKREALWKEGVFGFGKLCYPLINHGSYVQQCFSSTSNKWNLRKQKREDQTPLAASSP